ncbi:PTS system protein, component EIIc [Citrobacter freundii]|nr:PTS system protein, component EIIc [Citrobacter freundii]
MSTNHAVFNVIFRFVENYVSPVAGRISSQRHVMAIRDGFISAMPFMIVGSFLLVFAYPPFSPDTTWGVCTCVAGYGETVRRPNPHSV